MALVTTLAAKAPTVRLEIAGDGLVKPITVTEPGILRDSNVFSGFFLAEIASSTSIDTAWPRFALSFFVESPAWMGRKVEKRYVVYYARHPQTGQGFVYLPAAGEAWYDFNVRTILRNGLEGNWLHASERWARALNAYLP